MKIIYPSKFAREYKKLPDDIKNKAEEKEKLIPFYSISDHRIYR